VRYILIVDKHTVNAVKVKLVNSGDASSIIEDVRKMLEIKNALLWRSENTPACGSLFTFTAQLSREVDSLDTAVTALEKNDIDSAVRALDEYERYLEAKGNWVMPGTCAECTRNTNT
jgi:hypothetical protein